MNNEKAYLKVELFKTKNLLKIVKDNKLKIELNKNLVDIEKQIRKLEIEEYNIRQLLIRFKRTFEKEIKNEYRYPKLDA